MDTKMIQAVKTADNLVRNLLAVQPGEEVLIAVDPETDMRMAHAVAGAVESCRAEYGIFMMPVRAKERSNTISRMLDSAIRSCDVYITMTRSSGAAVYNTTLAECIKQKKLRECSMVLRDLDNYISGGGLADYEQVYADGLALQRLWTGRKKARVTSPAGTDLTFELSPMQPAVECGIARNPGDSMAYSDGEVSTGPLEDNMEGVMVIDGPMAYYGLPSKPIKMRIERGYVAEILDGDPKIVAQLRRLFQTVPNSDNIAEIGIGLNPMSLFNGDFEEEKKARGTIHFALGNGGLCYGQPNKLSEVHIDMVVYNSTVLFDDEVFVKDGRVVILDGR